MDKKQEEISEDNNTTNQNKHENEKCHSPKSRRSQDKDKTVPRKIVPKIASDTEMICPENIDALPESSSISGQTCSTSSGSWWSSPLSRLAGSGSSSQSVLSFDRLIPRSGESVNRKRPAEDSERLGDESQAQKSRKCSFKREYGKLKTMVPALGEREDLTKVEIIEETIRYIDALHHQLAARIQPPQQQQQQQQQEVPEPNTAQDQSCTPATPLRSLATTTSIAPTSGPSSSSASSSSAWSSPQDVKAAVENIQAMFAAYLEEQQPE